MANELPITDPLELAHKRAAEAKAQLEKEIAEDTANGFLNPFKEGVNYEHFLKACGGKANVKSYCKGKLDTDPKIDAEKLAFLLADLAHYNKDFPNNKNKPE
jgi:hypothetical protein